MSKDFDLSVFTGRKVIMIKVPNTIGICTIWDWNEKKNKYQRRDTGLKYYAYKKITQKQISKTFYNFEDAKKWRESEGSPDFRKNEMLFEEARSKYFEHLKQRVRVSTYDTYLSASKYLDSFNTIPISKINSQTVDGWLANLKRPEVLGLQHKTRLSFKHELSLLRGILQYFGEYISDDSYVLPIKRRHLEDCIVDHEKHQLAKNRNSKKFLTDLQLKSFLDQLEKNCKGESEIVYSFLGYFLAFTGCRVAEACALNWQDINLDLKGASISKSVMWPRRKGTVLSISKLTKSGENRIVPLMDVIIEKLQQLKQISKRELGLVFSLDGISPLGYRSIQYYFNKSLKEAGIEWRSCHIFRHTFATMFMTLTGMDKSLQGILGHKTSRMTEHYAKLTDQIREKGMEQFESAISNEKVLYFKRPAG